MDHFVTRALGPDWWDVMVFESAQVEVRQEHFDTTNDDDGFSERTASSYPAVTCHSQRRVVKDLTYMTHGPYVNGMSQKQICGCCIINN